MKEFIDTNGPIFAQMQGVIIGLSSFSRTCGGGGGGSRAKFYFWPSSRLPLAAAASEVKTLK